MEELQEKALIMYKTMTAIQGKWLVGIQHTLRNTEARSEFDHL